MPPRLAPATNLVELRRICRPAPLSGDELEAFYISTDEARGHHQNTRQLLGNTLREIPDARILFYGHRGCGKSTELNRLCQDLRGEYLIVTFSVEKEMNLAAARAEDLLVLICERFLQTAQEAGNALDEAALEAVYSYFATTTQKTSQAHDATAKLPAGAKGNSLLDPLLGLFASFSSEIQYNAHSEETSVATLRKRPGDLVRQANQVILAVTNEMPPGQKLLIVVEDLDKLDLARARPMFVDQVGLLSGLRTHIIFTIPVFLFHSPDAGAIRSHFDKAIALPMIKVSDPSSPEKPTGFDTVRQLVNQRLMPGLITNSALDLVIAQTGGVLRHVFEVLQLASTMVGSEAPLSEENIAYGLQQLGRELWTMVSLPHESVPGGPKAIDELYERLTEYAKLQEKGECPPIKPDAINQILLRSCALVQYNGEGWLGVHPLVMERLEQLGRL